MSQASPSPTSPRELAVLALHNASRELATAKRNYEAAILAAKEVGMTNSAIGRAIGRTEAAVRMFVKRKGTR